jgi:acyl-coenzyme A synthetase/AMP-(fatty) acid ligase
MENSPEMAAAMMGVWAKGGIVVMVHTQAPMSHLVHAISVTEPLAVLTDPEATVPDGVAVPVHSSAEVKPGSEPEQLAPASTHDPASIVFTSGSTGRPKGVTQSHHNLILGCHTVAGYLNYRDDDVIVCPVPWSFDYGFGQLLSTALLGMRQVLPTIANPFGLCEAIDRHRPTVLPGLPSWFTYLLRGVSPFRETDISSLRIITNTGGKIPDAVFADMLDAFSHCRIFLNYGLSETYRSSFLNPELLRAKAPSIGKGMPGVDLVVLRENGTMAEAGETGEIVHRGDCVFLGYWNDPDTTAKALRPDPLLPAGAPNTRPAMFTGDLGYTDQDGFLYFAGRRDHQLKSMGVRVSPGEVEELLHESGLLAEAAVFGVPHEMLGDEVIAAVVPRAGMNADRRALDRHCRAVMSQHMMPRRYLFLDSLPKTTSGKTDYPALKNMVTAPHRE